MDSRRINIPDMQQLQKLKILNGESGLANKAYANVNWDGLGLGLTPTNYVYVVNCFKGQKFPQETLITSIIIWCLFFSQTQTYRAQFHSLFSGVGRHSAAREIDRRRRFHNGVDRHSAVMKRDRRRRF